MTIPPDNLPGVITQAQQGSTEAVSRLYRAYAQLIYRYVSYRAGEDVVEDIVSAVFLKMVEALPDYRYTGAPFEAWLYRIAAARIADHHRQQTRRPQVALDEGLTADTPLPEEQVMDAQEQERLRAALQTLKPEQQDVLLLRFVERKSHQDVAALLGKSATAVKSIQHRALNRLAQALGSEQKARHYLRGSHE